MPIGRKLVILVIITYYYIYIYIIIIIIIGTYVSIPLSDQFSDQSMTGIQCVIK